jgi:hypothetical protein
MRAWQKHLLAAAAAPILLQPVCWAGEGPFFIIYTHQMEEPGNLEIATKAVMGKPDGGNRFFGMVAELEYGVKPSFADLPEAQRWQIVTYLQSK